MGKNAKAWARRKRLELITELGGKCKECGETEYEKLTFDHIHGKDWSARGKSTDQRMCRYIKEARLGLLQILCHVCNSRKGVPPETPEETERTAMNLEYLYDVPESLPDEPF